MRYELFGTTSCTNCVYDKDGACGCPDMTEAEMPECVYDYCPYRIGKESIMRKYIYIITSERANRRNDEYRNELYSDNEYEVGQIIEFDGLDWFVEEVIANE